MPRHRPSNDGGGSVNDLGRHGLELIAQRIVIASLETALLALAFACLDEVFQTPGPLGCGGAAFRAPSVSLHPQLIFPLPRNRQFRVFIFDWSSHLVFQTMNLIVLI